jgi:hypothetical protein
MHRPILTLIAHLADAVALQNPTAIVDAGRALAERIGAPAAAALARALAEEARPLEAVLEQPGVASCA